MMLERLLEQELDSAKTKQVEAHLSDCDSCQNLIQQLAGPTRFWSSIDSCLMPVDPDASQLESIASEFDQPINQLAPTAFLRNLLAPTDDPSSMGRLGNYEIVGVIGIGGMAIVVKGFDASLNRIVAIKLLAPNLAFNGVARQRFEREAKAAAAVVHENVLAIHAIDSWQGIPYLVMPYVRGQSLEKRIASQGVLPIEEILRIAHQIASGLAEAHAQGLVHRDIKPANILLGEGSERVKISDFGLARASDDGNLTRSGTIAGTPLYMSPEQARGEAVDCRSDIFSFGSLLYELCTGYAPFQAETPFGIIRRIQEDTPRPIRDVNHLVPQWLSRLIEMMQEKAPANRNLAAEQLASLFRVGLNHLQLPVGHPLPTALQQYSSTKSAGRRLRLFGWLTASASVAVIVWLTITSLNAPDRGRVAAMPFQLEVVSPQVASPKRSIDDVDPTLVVETDSNPVDPFVYQFQVGSPIYYGGSIELQRPEANLSIDVALRLDPVSVEDDEIELKYDLQFGTKLQYLDFIRSPFEPAPIASELRLLRDCSNQGRLKIRNDGTVLGRSRQSILPGQLGPLAEVLFVQSGNQQAEHARLQQFDLQCLNQAQFRGPPPTTEETVLLTRSIVTEPVDDEQTIQQVFTDTIENQEQLKTTDKDPSKIATIQVVSHAKYRVSTESGVVESITIRRGLDQLTDQQREFYSGLSLRLSLVDEASFVRLRERLASSNPPDDSD
ncbi:MAG: serine/threonine-protein kinase [Planctomycetota bacterium]